MNGGLMEVKKLIQGNAERLLGPLILHKNQKRLRLKKKTTLNDYD